MNSGKQRVAALNSKPGRRVSVVIASYQSEKYIAQAIESVLSQTLKGVEVLVQDDASTDRTVEIASFYANRGVLVRVNSVRLGPVASFNAGIASTSAPLVVKLDADDWLLPDHLSECERTLRVNLECAFVFTQAYRFRAGKLAGMRTDWPQDRVLDGRSFFLSVLRYGNPCASNTVMFRRTAYTAIGGFKERAIFLPYGEDLDLWLRLCTKGSVGYIARALAGVRSHRDGLTGKLQSPVNRRQLRVLAEAIDENAHAALEEGIFYREDWPEVVRLLARQWICAADACAFLPEDWKFCFERARRLSLHTVLCSRYSWRLLAKRVLGLRWSEAVRAQRAA